MLLVYAVAVPLLILVLAGVMTRILVHENNCSCHHMKALHLPGTGCVTCDCPQEHQREIVLVVRR